MEINIPPGLQPGPFYRSLGEPGSREMLGGGYMYKGGGCDHVNFESSYYAMSYVVYGEGEYLDSWGRTYPLRAGSFFQRFPGYVHSTRVISTDGWLELFIDMGPELTQVLSTMGILNPRQPCGDAGENRDWAQALLDFRIALEKAEEDALRLLLPQGLALVQRIVEAGRKSASSEDQAMLGLACQLLGTDWTQRLDIRRMCAEHGWGYERFRKVFKAQMGISPAQFRIRRRLDEARRRLLASPPPPLKDIAATLGYSSVYEFCAQFTRATGQPPGRFRKGRS